MTDALNDNQREQFAQGSGRPAWIAEDTPRGGLSASNEAAYVTAQTIHVNGGMALI